MRNQLLLAACTGQAVYMLTYLSARQLKGTGLSTDLKAAAGTLALMVTGALLAAGCNVRSINGYEPALVLVSALLAMSYFYYYESRAQPQTSHWLVGVWILSTICLGSLRPLFQADNGTSFLCLATGLTAGAGFYFSVGLLRQDKVLFGQNSALLVAVYCIFLLMDPSRAQSPETVSTGELSPRYGVDWVAPVLLLLSFITGLLLNHNNKTSC